MPHLDSLFLSVNDFARSTPALHVPATAYAKYGVLACAALMVIGWWLARSRGPRIMAAALLAPVTTVIAYGVQQVIVAIVAEPRPYTVHPDALLLVARNADPSFPSVHACAVAAAAAALFLVNRWLGATGAALAVLMAADRVYVGAHWPLDVVAGLLVGAVVSSLAMLVLRPLVTPLVARLSRTFLHPVLAS